MMERQRIINHFLNPYFDFAEFDSFYWAEGLRSFETNPQKCKTLKKTLPRTLFFSIP